MQGGNISNTLSPAIVLDIDDLIIHESKRLLGLITDLELTNDAKKVLNYLFNGDLGVYLVIQRAREVDFDKVVHMLEINYLPYTRHYWVQSPRQLEQVVLEANVVRYFRHTSLPDRVTMRSSDKAVMIDHIMEVSNYL